MEKAVQGGAEAVAGRLRLGRMRGLSSAHDSKILRPMTEETTTEARK